MKKSGIPSSVPDFFAKSFALSRFFRIFVGEIIKKSMTTQAMTQTIAEYFKTQPVLKAWLFGSYARGEERPDSDVDIMVDYDRNQRIGLFKISGMQLALQELIGHEVDLVDAEMMFPSVAKYANRDKKLIYERAN